MGLKAELKKAACFKCGAVGTLQEIVYGMPSSDFDFENDIEHALITSGGYEKALILMMRRPHSFRWMSLPLCRKRNPGYGIG